MSIETAALSIEELAENIRRENDRRYAFRRMLAATDALLEPLEQLNLRGIRILPAGAVPAIRRRLDELPSSCISALRDSDQVQEVLDGIFEVQDRLRRWRHPWLRDEEEAGEGGDGG
jgi:hypothetical protein